MEIYRMDVDGKSHSGLFGFYLKLGEASHSIVIAYRSPHGYNVVEGSFFEEVISRSSAVTATKLDSFSQLERMIENLGVSGESLFCESVAQAKSVHPQ